MDDRLQEMLDHYEITKTVNEYCHGCDRVDEAQMRSVYARESWDDHGTIRASGPEFARRMAAQIWDNSEVLSHLVGQTLINVDGDEAGAETYFFAVSQRVRDDGVRTLNELGGRFVDTLRREDGRWKIRNRVVVRDWTISLPIETDWPDPHALTPGCRSNDDPSYPALGTVHSGPPSMVAS